MSTEKIVDFNTLDNSMQELVKECIAVREMAYAPYSKFKVGAALRCEDGSITTGCNVENAAYPLAICAERVAIGKAISEGKRKFTAIAVAADIIHGSKNASPCGMCRQMMTEFGDMPVLLTSPDRMKIQSTSVVELLPFSFGFENIKNGIQFPINHNIE
ncbi:cytidine deaminase-like [Leptopilina boulardi]|uniref:cytidine deaminase-like n=1 Tax=Leptopilina boulardi TaxID=63433 RepID=UPI0021F5373C|nr:cytidine deaminase-like [Leptopilina boulardi]